MPSNFLAVFFLIIKPKKYWFLSLLVPICLIGLIPSIDGYLLKESINFVERYDFRNHKNAFLSNLIWYSLIYGLYWEMINFTYRLYDFLYLKTIPDTKAHIIEMYYSHVQKHSHSFFQKSLTGSVANKIADAARSFELIFAAINEKLLKKVLCLIPALIMLYSVKPIFATIFVIWIIVFLGISAVFSPKIKKLSSVWAESRSLITGKIVDNISNIASVRMYNNLKFEEIYLKKYLADMLNKEKILAWFMFKLRYAQGVSCSMMILSMVYYLGMLRAEQEITTGDFALIITLCIALCEGIWDFPEDLGDAFEEIGTFIQTLDLLKPHDINDVKQSHNLVVEQGRIEFLNVTFNYGTNDNVFVDKSIVIEAKQKVGLVGYSGSGKSTFVNLITRMFDVTSGKILIDGQDIKAVSQHSLRKNISVIPQEPILFNRSIVENIGYGKINPLNDGAISLYHESQLQEIFEAAKKACIHDDIMNMRDQYDTICGDKGSSLSGGQRQRVAIARAILKNSPILILDEATSALDTITEMMIHDSLEFLMKDKTVLVIAHRLSTLKNMDRIIVFDNGKIIEDGTHNQLYQEGKLYRQFWDSQVGGFIVD
jgi:ATP-binding cassette, subfamily B, bacterial